MAAGAQPEQSRWSVSRLAREFSMDRRKISGLIEGAPIAGTEQGNPVYRLRDVAPMICRALPSVSDSFEESGEIDPSTLRDPAGYKAYWTGTEARIRAEKMAGRLVPADMVEAQIRMLVAPLVAWLETLPDVLERDADLTTEQADILRRSADAERARIAESIDQ